MKKFKLVFVHGHTASSKKDWYPAISAMLEKHGIDYSIPNLPGGEYPKRSQWIKKIKKEVQKVPKPVVLIGHSLGTRAILLFLEQHSVKLHSVFLISAFNNNVKTARKNIPASYRNFFRYPVNIDKIKSRSKNFYVIHSKDDDTIDYSQAKEIANQLNAKMILCTKRGHFSDEKNARYIFRLLEKELEV